MYDIWFYLFFWLLGIFLAFPLILIFSIWILFQPAENKNEIITLKAINVFLSKIKNKSQFEAILKSFLDNFKIYSSKDDLSLWLEVIKKFSSSEYFDTEQVANFRKSLEDMNEDISQDISDAVGNALKNKKKG